MTAARVTTTMRPRAAGSLLVAAALLAAGAARADPSAARPLDGSRVHARLALFPEGVARARLDDPPADAPQSPDAPPPSEDEPAKAPPPPEPPERPSLDFDLLGEAKPPPEAADAGKLRLRRKMLTVHQGIGLGLIGLQLATTVVGQLNYSDRFGGAPETGRYRLAHKTLAYSTLGVFATNGLIALLAPSPKTPRKLDRVMVHRLSMLTATAGMIAQAVLGIYTRERIGRLDQDRFATAHLAVGYVTLAAVLTGVGALVF